MRRASEWELGFVLARNEYKPIDVTWDITFACQLNCRHCYLMNIPRRRGDELPLQRVEEILDELEKLGTLNLAFSGGDPFLYKDFLRILDCATSAGFAVTVLTSGMMINDKIAQQLNRCRVAKVEMTLSGADPRTHDTFTRRPGSFEHVQRAIRVLRDAGVSVRVKTVVLRTNINQLDDIEELCSQLGVEWSADPLVWQPWNGNESQVADMRLNCGALAEFYARYRSPESLAGAAELVLCTAGRTAVYINPWGRVSPCLTYAGKVVVGDLNAQTFTEIWEHSSSLEEYRRLTPASYPKCNSCQMIAFCDWCPGLSFWAGKRYDEPYEKLCESTSIKMEVWAKQANSQ